MAGSPDKNRRLGVLLEQWADCTIKCKSYQHAGQLICAATQSCGEHDIIAWIARHCHTPARTRDENGRSLLHIAASLGRNELINWILKYKDGMINSKDVESGYSALHRAAFFGHIQTLIFLIKQGSNLALTDNNGLTALDHILVDRPQHVAYSLQAPLEAYVWGINSNYNLGTGDNSTKNNPDLIEHFRKLNKSVKKVVLQKFHSAFLTSTGTVYICGHGRGGRLGIGSETMLLSPKSIQQLDSCTDVALGVDHSIFLTSNGIVYTCGENTFHQLGQQPPSARLLAPSPVGGRGGVKPPPAVGVAAGRYHSAFWTDDAVYTWGLNAGQLGHIKGEKTIILPKLVPSLTGNETKIEQVCVSDGATIVYTNKGDVMALYGYTTKKLGIRQYDVKKIQVIGGHLDPAVDPGGSAEIDFKLVAGGGTNLKVYLLDRVGKVQVWEEGRDKNFLTCTLTIARAPPIITDIAPFREGLMLVSAEGEAWTASVSKTTSVKPGSAAKIRPNSPIKSFGKAGLPTVALKLKRISHIHRAVAAATDPKGRNYCILQVSPREALTEVPEIPPSTIIQDMSRLLQEADEFDGITDTVCVTGGSVRFPVHSFVLASGSETLAKQIKFAETLEPTVLDFQEIQPQIFEQILQFLYTRKCDLAREGPCPIHFIGATPTAGEEVNDKNRKNRKKSSSPLLDSKDGELSAFAVYDKNRKKKIDQPPPSTGDKKKTAKSSNPLTELLEAGKMLGLYGLAKLLECFRYSEGYIYRKCKPPTPRLEFSFKNLEELSDLTIETEEGDEVFVHKSILVARSEYFHGMFSSRWAEAETNLKLPIQTIYVECILDFLYRDESRAVNKSEDTEFVSNVLVLSDQFLISRLKDCCEGQLSRLVTLKNVADMLEFAFVYQAEQLKRTCLQFVCINLPALLETRSLENIEPQILDVLDSFYLESNSVVQSRRITPIAGYPSGDEILHENQEVPVSQEELEAMEVHHASVNSRCRARRHSSGEKPSRRSPKPQPRVSESSSLGSGSGSDSEDGGLNVSQDMDKLSLLDFDIQEKDEVSSPEEKRSPVKDRDTSFFSSLLSAENGTTTPAAQATTFNGTPVAAVGIPVSVPVSKAKKFQKLSQKERKRLSMETSGGEEMLATTPDKDSPTKVWGGWKAPVKSPDVSAPSLLDIMASQNNKEGWRERKASESGAEVERRVSESSKQQPEASPAPVIKKSSWKQLDLTADKSQGPAIAAPAVNPWNLNGGGGLKSPDGNSEPLQFPDLTPDITEKTSFSQIMRAEVEEERVLVSALTKPLHLTQLEETAIQELRNVYSLQYPGEKIDVNRVSRVTAAAPVWKKIRS